MTGPDAFGAAAALGASALYARADHDHGLPSLPTIPTQYTDTLAVAAVQTAFNAGTLTDPATRVLPSFLAQSGRDRFLARIGKQSLRRSVL